LIVILGAAVSSFSGLNGIIMLEEGDTKHYFVVFKESPQKAASEGRMPNFDKVILPFGIKLQKFSIDYYYNSFIPSKYISRVEIITLSQRFEYEIQVNKPLKFQGYEIFQSDFVLAGQSGGKNVSVFSVNYDKGKNIAFVGFVILLCGVINLFLLKNFWRRFDERVSDNKEVCACSK
jgi:cytochrome c biogenesis protein ResB